MKEHGGKNRKGERKRIKKTGYSAQDPFFWLCTILKVRTMIAAGKKFKMKVHGERI